LTPALVKVWLTELTCLQRLGLGLVQVMYKHSVHAAWRGASPGDLLERLGAAKAKAIM
jgi:hypothetical protein